MSVPKATDVNEYAARLLQAATEGGWTLLAFDTRMPGRITVMDGRGTELTLEGNYGLDFVEYLSRPALQRRKIEYEYREVPV